MSRLIRLEAALVLSFTVVSGCRSAVFLSAPLSSDPARPARIGFRAPDAERFRLLLSLAPSEAGQEWCAQLGRSATEEALAVTPTPIVSWTITSGGAFVARGWSSPASPAWPHDGRLEVTVGSFDPERGADYEIEAAVANAPPRFAEVDPVLVVHQPKGGRSAFRARVGVGLGIGVHVQVSGVLHAGALLGAFLEVGPTYDWYGNGPLNGYAALGPFHSQGTGFKSARSSHACIGLLPGPLRELLEDDHAHPWAIEIGVALLGVDLQLGVDPEALLEAVASP